MSSPRLWVLILALVCFLAGVVAGLVGGEISRETEAGDRPFGDFERRFVACFDLGPADQSLLAEVLAHYNSEVERIKADHEAENHSQMEAELRTAGEEYRALVRELLRPGPQRLEFDRQMTDFDYADNS